MVGAASALNNSVIAPSRRCASMCTTIVVLDGTRRCQGSALKKGSRSTPPARVRPSSLGSSQLNLHSPRLAHTRVETKVDSGCRVPVRWALHARCLAVSSADLAWALPQLKSAAAVYLRRSWNCRSLRRWRCPTPPLGPCAAVELAPLDARLGPCVAVALTLLVRWTLARRWSLARWVFELDGYWPLPPWGL